MNLKKITNNLVYRNISVLGISEVFIRIAKFILLAIAARLLGPTDFGVFNYFLAIAALIAVVGDFGINRIITRNVSQHTDRIQLYLQSFSVQTTLLLLYVVFGSVAVFLFVPQANLPLFIMLAIFTAVNIMGDYLWSFTRALENMAIEAKAKMLQAMTVLVAGLALLYSPWPLLGLGASYVLGALATLFIAVKFITKEYSIPIRLDFRVWLNLISQSWPIAIVAVSAFVFNQIDSIMLGAYGLLDEVGFYNAAYRIISGLLIPVFIINQVLFPKLSKMSFGQGIAIIRKSLFANLLLYAAVSIGVYLFGEWFLGLVYGEEYMVAYQSFFILSLALLLTSLVYSYSNFSIAHDHLRLNLVLSVLAAVINIGLNLYLIPTYGYLGAAAATVFTYSFLLVGYVASLYWINLKRSHTDTI